MPMREQDARQALEARAGLQDLTLCAFAAVHQKTIFVVGNNLPGKAALGGGCGSRGAEKQNFEQQCACDVEPPRHKDTNQYKTL